MSGIMIGEKHTERDWGLIWTDVEIEAPEEQRKYINIPGRDGALDLTEALKNGVKYGNRGVTNTFILPDRNIKLWHRTFSEIQNYCHGKVKKIYLDSDPSYYYMGRVSVSTEREDAVHSSIVISCNAEPYKYERTSSLEPWKWDTFSFKDGIIRNYKNLSINGTRTVTIRGREMRIVPVIEVSAAMTVDWAGKTHSLKPGKNKIYDIELGPGENTLVFKGKGTVSIDYRGGSL